MGSRGASSGIAKNGKRYGTEYRTVLKSGNIKFVKYNDSTAAKAPLETMTRGRVYVTLNSAGKPAYISYYDTANKRTKTIDLDHFHAGMKPHVHHGYHHNENGSPKGASALTPKERRMTERVENLWYNHNHKS